MEKQTIKKNTIHLESRLSTAMIYLIVGMILSSFTLDVGYIKYFQLIGSSVCFYLGLRLIKRLSALFKYAHLISVFLLITTTLMHLLTIGSPLDIPNILVITNILINIMMMFLIAWGLNSYVMSHQNISFISLYILSILFGIVFQGNDINFILFLTFCMIMFLSIRSLWKCRQEIIENGLDRVVDSPRLQASVFIGGWIVICYMISIAIPYAWPFLAYNYIDMSQTVYSDPVNVKKDLEFFDQASVYQTDKGYKIVLEYQKEEMAEKYSFIDIQCKIRTSRSDYSFMKLENIVVSDEKAGLKAIDVTEDQFNVFFNDGGQVKQRFYMNPLSNSMKVIVSMDIDKNYFNNMDMGQEEYQNVFCSIEISGHDYGKTFDSIHRYYEELTIDKNGKINKGL